MRRSGFPKVSKTIAIGSKASLVALICAVSCATLPGKTAGQTTAAPQNDSSGLWQLAYKQAHAGKYGAAERIYKQLAELYEADKRTQIKVLNIIPAWADVLYAQNKHDEVNALFQHGIDIAQKKFAPKDARVPRTISVYARCKADHGDLEGGHALYKVAIELNAKTSPQSYSCVTTAFLGVANTAFRLGNFSEADTYYHLALKQSEIQHPNGDSVAAVSAVGIANTDCSLSKLTEALPLYQKALAIYQRMTPVPQLEVSNILQNMANMYALQEKYSSAESYYKQALTAVQKAPNSAKLANTVEHNLVELYKIQHKYADAEHLYRQTLSEAQERGTLNHTSALADMFSLADIFEAQDKFADAVEVYNQLLAITDPDHIGQPSTALIYEKLGKQRWLQNRDAEAIEDYLQAKNFYMKRSDHDGTMRCFVGLGDAYYHQKDFERAVGSYEDGLAMGLSNGSKGSAMRDLSNHIAGAYVSLKQSGQDVSQIESQQCLAQVPTILHNSAADAYNLGKYSESAQLFQRAAQMQFYLKGPKDKDLVSHLVGTANSEYMLSQYEQAEKHYSEALKYSQEANGADSPEVANLLTGIAGIYAEEKRYKEAEDTYNRASHIFRQVTGWESADQARCMQGLASVYVEEKNYDSAEPLFKHTIAMREKILGPSHPALASSLDGLAHLYEKKGDYMQAETLYKRSLAILQHRLDPLHPLLVENLANLADVYRKEGRYTDAEPLYKQALAAYSKSKDVDKAEYAACASGYAQLLESTDRVPEATEIASKANMTLSQAKTYSPM